MRGECESSFGAKAIVRTTQTLFCLYRFPSRLACIHRRNGDTLYLHNVGIQRAIIVVNFSSFAQLLIPSIFRGNFCRSSIPNTLAAVDFRSLFLHVLVNV